MCLNGFKGFCDPSRATNCGIPGLPMFSKYRRDLECFHPLPPIITSKSPSLSKSPNLRLTGLNVESMFAKGIVQFMFCRFNNLVQLPAQLSCEVSRQKFGPSFSETCAVADDKKDHSTSTRKINVGVVVIEEENKEKNVDDAFLTIDSKSEVNRVLIGGRRVIAQPVTIQELPPLKVSIQKFSTEKIRTIRRGNHTNWSTTSLSLPASARREKRKLICEKIFRGLKANVLVFGPDLSLTNFNMHRLIQPRSTSSTNGITTMTWSGNV